MVDWMGNHRMVQGNSKNGYSISNNVPNFAFNFAILLSVLAAINRETSTECVANTK